MVEARGVAGLLVEEVAVTLPVQTDRVLKVFGMFDARRALVEVLTSAIAAIACGAHPLSLYLIGAKSGTGNDLDASTCARPGSGRSRLRRCDDLS
jgi:hypothetical protein